MLLNTVKLLRRSLLFLLILRILLEITLLPFVTLSYLTPLVNIAIPRLSPRSYPVHAV
jgi:hypothetical protein